MLYSYLAHGVGCSETQGAFRALTRGYSHWVSGRLVQLEVQTLHPLYCHIRATLTPSMKPRSYHVYVLLMREGLVGTIQAATCECAAGYDNIVIGDICSSAIICIHFIDRKLASCTHVSAVLHALVAMTSTGQIHPPDNLSAIPDDEEEATSVTSHLCQ